MGVIQFLAAVLREKGHMMGREGARLAEAAEALIAMCRVWDTSGCVLREGEIQACWDHYHQFCELTDHLPELLAPKRHVICHLLDRLHYLGNPKYFANWFDESLNKVLRNACRQLSQSTFEPCLLVNMEALLEKDQRWRKRKLTSRERP